MAERNATRTMRTIACLKAGNAGAQMRKRAHARAGHERRSFSNLPSSFFGKNPELIYLFMVCSNIKLTMRRESIGIGLVVFFLVVSLGFFSLVLLCFLVFLVVVA